MARRTIAAAPFSKTTKATPRLAYWFRCLSVKNGSTLTTSNLSGGIVIEEILSSLQELHQQAGTAVSLWANYLSGSQRETRD
jgi:hypothetical protein